VEGWESRVGAFGIETGLVEDWREEIYGLFDNLAEGVDGVEG